MSNRINRLHKRGLRALLNDEISTIKDMLSQSNDTKTHVKKIQTLMTEFYKYLYGFSAPMIQEVFTKISLTLFRMGFFGAAHGWWGGGGPNGPLAKNLSHISYNCETWHSYPLPKEDPKSI